MSRAIPTIYERIITALRARGRTESERAFSSSLGFSPTYLSQLRDRCEKNPLATIDVDTAMKVAAAIGITVEELMGVANETDDRYPSRHGAVIAARALQYSQRAIDAVYAESPPNDPGRLWWFRRIEAEETRILSEGHASSGRLRR